jgi:hypothetical protein
MRAPAFLTPPPWTRAPVVPALASLAAAGAIVFVALPLLHVLSLDFRALTATLRLAQYDLPAVRDEWIDWADRLLRYGSLPLLLALAVRFVAWAVSRERPGSWTPDRLRPWQRTLAAAAILVPFIAFSVPCALALSVWLIVEVFAWMQWIRSWDSLAERVIRTSVPILLPALLLAGIIFTSIALRRRPVPRPPAWWRRVAGAALLLVVLAVGLAAVIPGAGLIVHASRVLPVMGSAGTFERGCSGCHVPVAPLPYVKTPDEWRYHLEATCFNRPEPDADERERLGVGYRGLSRNYHRYEFGDEKKEEILSFLAGMRSYPDSWAFRTRCQRCHWVSYLAWEDRDPEDWQMIVDRVGRYSLLYFNRSVKRQIVQHLSAEHSGEGSADAGPERVKERKAVRACTGCHFMSRNADANRDLAEGAAVDLVRRMSGMMTVPLSESDVIDVAEGYRALVRDPERMKHVVPHDRPETEGDLPW